MSQFFQDGPVLGNQYEADKLLRSYLNRVLPGHILAEIEPDLLRLGQRVITDIREMADDAEANPPVLIPCLISPEFIMPSLRSA